MFNALVDVVMLAALNGKLKEIIAEVEPLVGDVDFTRDHLRLFGSSNLSALL